MKEMNTASLANEIVYRRGTLTCAENEKVVSKWFSFSRYETSQEEVKSAAAKEINCKYYIMTPIGNSTRNAMLKAM